MSVIDTVKKREKGVYILNGLHCSSCGAKIEMAPFYYLLVVIL